MAFRIQELDKLEHSENHQLQPCVRFGTYMDFRFQVHFYIIYIVWFCNMKQMMKSRQSLVASRITSSYWNYDADFVVFETAGYIRVPLELSY